MTAQQDFNYTAAMTRLVIKIIVGIIIALIALIWTWRWADTQFQVHQAKQDKKAAIIAAQAQLESAEFNKRIAVQEALAKKDSAQDLADAEVIRARGVAEANKIIANSITDAYVRWLYVDQLDEINGQIIYVPTEGGIPVLEAGRGVERSNG
jgi:Tfp pilus assembly protein PilX